MPRDNANLSDWKRRIDGALEDAGFTDCLVETKWDAEGKVVAEITIEGRKAHGLAQFVLHTIEQAKNEGVPLTTVFESLNMYAGPI